MGHRPTSVMHGGCPSSRCQPLGDEDDDELSSDDIEESVLDDDEYAEDDADFEDGDSELESLLEHAASELSDEEVDEQPSDEDLAGIRQRATMVELGNKVLGIVTGARNAAYGNPYDNHLTEAQNWTTYLRRCGKLAEDEEITAEDVCWMMLGLKQARQAHWSQEDNAADAVGYALNAWACHVEHAFRMNQLLQQ
jgi:hypothetical protein